MTMINKDKTLENILKKYAGSYDNYDEVKFWEEKEKSMFGPGGCCGPHDNVPQKIQKISLLKRLWNSLKGYISYLIPIRFFLKHRKGYYFPVTFPMIRRVFGELIPANEIVAIQPMSAPLGLIFFLEFVSKSRFRNRLPKNKKVMIDTVFGHYLSHEIMRYVTSVRRRIFG